MILSAKGEYKLEELAIGYPKIFSLKRIKTFRNKEVYHLYSRVSLNI
jgi:hypothetical protein